MKVCGVELKSNEVNICLLSKKNDLFDIPDCRVRKLTLDKAHCRESLQHFQSTFVKLMEDYKVEKVVIRERPTKGKLAGSAASFKVEAAIQLGEGFDVELVQASTIKERIREKPLPISFAETELKSFQELAFLTAYASLC